MNHKGAKNNIMAQFAHKKSLGQNFLTNNAIIQRIVEFASVTSDDVVIEIGPGQGVLTEALAHRAKKVIAIELDDRLMPILKKRFRNHAHVSIVHGDILHMDFHALIASHHIQSRQYKVVANIPYYITAPIIRLLLEQQEQPLSVTLMVQKEVAERLSAQPGNMSIVAVAAQYYARVEYGFTVSRNDFDPVPAVDSAVVRLSIKNDQVKINEDVKNFFRVVKIGFSARRKTLSNNLANGLYFSKDEVAAMLHDADIKENVRAQELSVEQWYALSQIVSQRCSKNNAEK